MVAVALVARAAASCFWSVWWVRIRERVAREEREDGFLVVGGRVLERRGLRLWGLEPMTVKYGTQPAGLGR